ncbi:MAG: hypothetical protein ACI8RZ_003674 [Myxococcota bacterium]|jgi:hypothetical protein
MKEALWVLGGLSIGSGVLMMLGRFNGPSGIGIANENGEFSGHAAQVYHTTGYDTIGDLMVFGQGWLALILGAAGIAMMVYANAGAWKETGGY